ncbi:ThuA domain-containing protein [Streptosporangium sp. NBC_01469]|uniref:ThuA domain-containing protein n=1 Tax=Streptosporangium sp. NBC_01469 TaxID=2903898 RepID=UPI002E283D9A|nr:ThuA domain-containing protein [Streptosporangium sp. NBC_01469]
MSPRSRTWARLSKILPITETPSLRRTAATVALALVVPLMPVFTLMASPANAASDTKALASSANAADPDFKVLVFSKTSGFRHDSIPEGIAAVQKLGLENNFAVDTTEDSAQFTDANLAQYQAVIFMSTTGDPITTPDQKAAFERYIQGGGGFAGIHAASDSGYNWEWYGKLVGAYFKSHPATQQATVLTEDLAHPSTSHLPTSWTRVDEWYDFQANPRNSVHVLQSMNQKSYTGSTQGIDHPISWCQDYDGGRSWYTGLGHTKESFAEPNFTKMLLGGIKTAAGAEKADCSASQSGSFEKVTLDDNTANPMMTDIAKDGRVFYIDRLGDVKIIKTTGSTVTAGRLNVFTANESGLLGLALDRNFATNNWLYLFYSPTGQNVDRLSRFTVNGDVLDFSSEKVVLNVPVQRAECCHHGGGMMMDHKTGDLWLATGDNTNPFASDGYTPIDEQAGRSSWDAQRTSGSTNDLSGKLLRITPQDDGTYTVPTGNLFPPGTDKTKPEIYAMGFRNPFRMGLDPKTGFPMVADYGPDSGAASATRGPRGTVEWNLVSKPGNYGWPFCVGDNTPYIDYNFATSTSGSAFNCAAPVNNSPNNTGLTTLPPAIAASIPYTSATNPNSFPELNGGAPMAGPVYRYDADLQSPVKWPAYWDGKAIFGEWNTNKMFSFQLNEAGNAQIKINQILSSLSFKRPMDIKFGPDGALYLIEWGSGFGGDNADSGIYRIEYAKGTRPPVARVSADKTDGPAPLTVQFSSQGSSDPDGKPLTYAWDFDGDDTTDSTEANPSHTFTEAGQYSVVLTVSNPDGLTGTANVPITAGNTRPVVTLELPPNGAFFEFGDQVNYKIVVTDAEDGTIDCDDVKIQAYLGHDSHGHPLDQHEGCEGTIQTLSDSGHGIDDNLFYILEATYADKGGSGGAQSLTGRGEVILQPKRKQAEHFSATGRVANGTGTDTPGVQTETTTDPQGGAQNIGFTNDGDYWSYTPINLGGISKVRFRVSSGGAGGTVQIKTGNADTGTLVGSVDITPTGGWQTFQDITVDLTNVPATTGPLFFIVRKPASAANDAYLLNFNWVDFIGQGATDNQRPTVTVAATPTTGVAPLKVDFTSTATDPDNNTPLTYKWNFGVNGSPEPTTANASHTYTAPGTYTATVTVTDTKGASTSKTVSIKVDPPSTTCFTGRSDDFLGTSLDRDRWSVVREDQNLRVADGKLILPTSLTEIYNTGAGTVTNITVQPLPQGAWTATTKVTMAASQQYQQAGLVVYGDDNNYAKMVLQGRSATPDHAARIFQFIREENGVPNEVAASNTANLGNAFPDTYYVRFMSDGTNLTAHYSADGTTFTAMPETKALAGITNPRIGLISFASTGTSKPVIDAAFDWFHISPDDTAGTAEPSDEFNGTSLDACRWNAIVRGDSSAARVTGGNLEIDTQTGDIFGTGNTAPKNFILQTAPSGDWTLETKVDGSALNEQYQQGGLILYTGDDDYVKLDYVVDNTAGSAVSRRIELRSEVAGIVQDPQPQVGSLTQGVWHLRLKKEGTSFKGSYSADGTTWTEFAQAVTNTAVGTGKIGVYTIGTAQQASKTVKFDYFRLNGGGTADSTAPTTTATPDPAQPANGWFNSLILVTLAGADEAQGSGVDKTEFQLDNGAWTTYLEPVVITGDGNHTLAYRSVDKAGNVEATKTLAVKVDATAPTTTADFLPVGQNTVPVTLAAADATSGVEKIEYALDSGDWTPYTTTVNVTGVGDHELRYRATDKAGNVEETKAATIKIEEGGTQPTILISGVADGTEYGDSQDLTIAWEVAGAGIKTVTGKLDGQPFTSGTVQQLHKLALGEHTLTVTVETESGGTYEQSVAFKTVTSTDEISALIERFEAAGQLSATGAAKLQDKISKVMVSEDKERERDKKKIVKKLERFIEAVNDPKIVSNATVKATFLRDANALIVANGGTPV